MRGTEGTKKKKKKKTSGGVFRGNGTVNLCPANGIAQSVNSRSFGGVEGRRQPRSTRRQVVTHEDSSVCRPAGPDTRTRAPESREGEGRETRERVENKRQERDGDWHSSMPKMEEVCARETEGTRLIGEATSEKLKKMRKIDRKREGEKKKERKRENGIEDEG